MSAGTKPNEPPRAMIQLYGVGEAKKVDARCRELDPFFGEWVAKEIYDTLWELPPLNFLDKSLVTIISLIVLEREEQLQIHLRGFLHQGKTPDHVVNILNHMSELGYITSAEKSLNILKGVSEERGYPLIPSSMPFLEEPLSAREVALIKLSVCIAKGNPVKTKTCLIELSKNGLLTEEEQRGVMRHQMTYCGCPCSMNGFALLKEIAAELKGRGDCR